MEAKLKEYRARRRRQELIQKTKDTLENSKEKLVTFLTPKFLTMEKEKQEDEVLEIENEEQIPEETNLIELEELTGVSELEPIDDEKQESWRYFTIKWCIYAITWVTLYLFFLKIQFGAVFFVLSVLVGIYLNTRTRPKRKGEVSAYSVFNKNCTSIDGTLKAEQFEREIRYGPASVR